MVYNYFLDTNVVIDFLEDRDPFADFAEKILTLARNKKLNLFISALSISNIDYILKKKVGKETSLQLLEGLIQFIKILPVSEQEILAAMKSGFPDFEDAIQHFTALQNPDIKGIITRNVKDYKKSQIPIFTPESLIAIFK